MLLYPKELVSLRPNLGRGLLQFKPHPLRQKYKRLLREAFAQSTIHGVQHIVEAKHLYIRYFWLCIVLLSSVSFIVVFSMLRHQHNEQQLVSVVATTQYPVYNIQFPAVAICPRNHVNWLRYSKAAHRFLPRNADSYMRESFHEVLVAMEQMNFGEFQDLTALSKRNLSSLAHISLGKLASYLAYRCDELLLPQSCVFDETEYDCCQLFVQERTNKGVCLVFNSLISADSRKKKLIDEFYPYKLSTAGEGSGLRFILRVNESSFRTGTNATFSAMLIIKEADQWTNNIVYQLNSNTENLLSIDPVLKQTSTNTYSLEPTKRGCYFDDERHPDFRYGNLAFSRANCMVSCLQWTVQYYCNCSTPLYLPRIDNTRECNVLDFPCLQHHTDIFGYVKLPGQDNHINDPRHGMLCDCPDRCNVQLYETYLNVRQWTNSNTTNSTEIKAEIYYGQRVLTKIETKLRYTFQNWMAGFGGILALYTGASGLSFFELDYIAIRLSWSLFKDIYTKLKRKL